MKKPKLEIEEKKIKKLNLLETVSGKFNTDLGYSVSYTRIYGGLIRTTVTPEGISQLFIPLPASFFV